MDNINVDFDARVSHAAGREAKKLTHCNHHSTGKDDANSKGTPLSEIATHADELVIRRNASAKYSRYVDMRPTSFLESSSIFNKEFYQTSDFS